MRRASFNRNTGDNAYAQQMKPSLILLMSSRLVPFSRARVDVAEIDQIVYRLFDLTPDEIDLIESALAPTRSPKPSRKRSSGTKD